MLAAAAAAVLDSPNCYEHGALSEGARARYCYDLQEASAVVLRVLPLLVELRTALRAPTWGTEGRRLAGVLALGMQHVAVRRLQVALLDQLAAHAGMGAKLQEAGEGGSCPQILLEGLEGEGQQQQQADGWEGSSGTWWLAREEARRGRVLSLGPAGADGNSGGEVPGLEDYHTRILRGSVAEWVAAAERDEAEAGWLLAAPPPLLAARLVARAAEALCRLCRGQGVGGAYAPAPEWLFAKSGVSARVEWQMSHQGLRDRWLRHASLAQCCAITHMPTSGAGATGAALRPAACEAACGHGPCLPAVLDGDGGMDCRCAGRRHSGGHGACARHDEGKYR